MELGLSLGDTPKPFSFLENSEKKIVNGGIKDLGFCMVVDKVSIAENNGKSKETGFCSSDPPVQLDLLPFSPVHTTQQYPSSNKFPFPWLNQKLGGDSGRDEVVEVNRKGSDEEMASLCTSSNTVSSFQMDFSIFTSSRGKIRDLQGNTIEADRGTSSRGSDDEENGIARKKLRLSKEQSAFLEQSFKEHNTLNPKQKVALAKHLNLRPRQVEVWFQNRRARTKLKQTEVDCEYLKRWCETLTEENRRLQKEVQELRALKASKPFYMQLPATTLTMCPSCQRVAPTTTPATAANKPTKHLSHDHHSQQAAS